MITKWNAPEIIAKVRTGVMRGIGRGILTVEREAVRLILNTPKTGRIYRRRGIDHQASAPGEPFASDTGRTLASRTTELFPAELRARLVFRSKIARYLEYGTRRMEPRPFARPALANSREQVAREVVEEVRKELGGK